jgi:hypothetical protein
MNRSLPHDQTQRRWTAAIAAARRALRLLLRAGVLLAVLPASAGATPEYPLVIDASLGVSCPRPLSRCLICHTTARGGQRTAVQPFAQTMNDYGLTRGHDVGALQTALQGLPEETNSDDEGLPDKEELRVCGNPSGAELGIGPEYGCDGAHLARNLPSDVPLILVAVGAVGAIVRRCRAAPVPSAARKTER